MAKQEISIDTMYLLFEEIRAEIIKLGKSSDNFQVPAEVPVDLSSIEARLVGLDEQLSNLADKTTDTTLLAELQDIKKKINSIPEPIRGATTRELEQGLSMLHDKLTKTIKSVAKSNIHTIAKNRLSNFWTYTIVIIILAIAGIGVNYAKKYNDEKKKRELLQHYYVRYKYIEAKTKATKADLEWLNTVSTDSIMKLTRQLEERTNPKQKK